MDKHSIKVSFIINKSVIQESHCNFYCAFASIHFIEVNSIDKAFQVGK